MTGPARGLAFTGGGTPGYVLGLSERAVQNALSDHLKPGGVFFDVGAHAGFLSVLACRLVGTGGQVHSFEPAPESVTMLRRNLDANGFTNATIHEVALADRDGTAGMSHTKHAITARLADDGDFTVPLARADSLGLPAPTVVKIDVEGAECLVLEGMTEQLSSSHPVVIVEIHAGNRERVRARLTALGYAVTQLDDDGGMPHLIAT